MLQLLGFLLKTIITIAIGIMGFTWEPKQEIKSPPSKENRGELMIPVYLTAPVHKAIVIDAGYKQNASGCNKAPQPPIAPPAPKRLPGRNISI